MRPTFHANVAAAQIGTQAATKRTGSGAKSKNAANKTAESSDKGLD